MQKNLKHIFSYVLILTAFWSYSQNEAANWYFGAGAGVSFNSGFPVAIFGSELSTEEGCSTISDEAGNLLFYSDGETIWNRNHIIMQNGNGLLGHGSSTQSALIVPKPNSSNIYYIFTVDEKANGNGLMYSEINMSLGGGLGAVTSNKNILLDSPTSEKITAIESADGLSIWVISHRWNSNEFISFLVSSTGVTTTPVVSAVGSVHQASLGNNNNSIGCIKASPNREKVACVKSYQNNETQVFDFDASSGALSNPITIANYSTNNRGPYGCEFSPDSKLLYVTEINNDGASFSKIHQYDLTQPTQQAIINSDIIIAQENEELGALQQAIDGKVYVAVQGSAFLAVIHEPNVLGTASDFELNAVFLGGNQCQYGLPPFIQSYFFATNIFTNTCFGDSTEFTINTSTIIDGIQWDFGDPASGANNTSTNLNPTHTFSGTGDFNITITIDTEGETQIVYRTLTISDSPPTMNLDPLLGCENENGTAEFNLESSIPDIIINDPDLEISYFESEMDAETFTNPIPNFTTYTNISDPQTIYVRLQNSTFGDCISVSELELMVIENPIVEPTDEVSFCENSSSDFAIIDVGNLDGNLSDYNFLWLETNETSSQIQVNTAGVYTVRITPLSSITTANPDGCYSERMVTVISSSIATINGIEVVDDISANILTTGLGDYEYALDNSSGPYQNSNFFGNIEAGIHTIYVRDRNNCGIVEDTFSIIGFPKFFTPNNDGYNDTWGVKGISTQFQPRTDIYIYDRFGKLLKQLNPLGLGWDGTLNGNALPNGDYWFSVTLQDGRTFMNHFTLKR